MRAAIYARISLDRQDGAGVARQLADCRELCESRGWDIEGEYVENSTSAYTAKRRPEWQRMLADLGEGRIGVVVAYHPDRLYRRLGDLAGFIEAVKTAGAEVATVKAGDIDLATASGRMVAGHIGTAAIYEAERIAERVSRAKKSLAAQGKPPGGGMRPFGFKDGGMELEPREADAIREAAGRVASGSTTVYRIAIEWNTSGVTTSVGKPWRSVGVRRILTSHRVAGLRDYQGELVGPAAWPAIIDQETWQRLRAMAAVRARNGLRSHDWLLSALIACPHCGRVMYGSAGRTRSAYVCAPPSHTPGRCGRASIATIHADRKVSEVIEGMLDEAAPHVAESLAHRTPNVTAELDAIDATRIGLAQRWAAGSMTDAEYDAARAVLTARSDALDQPAPRYPQAVNLPDLRGAWDRGTVDAKRAVIRSLIRLPIQLAPGRAVNPGDRLTILPAWD